MVTPSTTTFSQVSRWHAQLSLYRIVKSRRMTWRHFSSGSRRCGTWGAVRRQNPAAGPDPWFPVRAAPRPQDRDVFRVPRRDEVDSCARDSPPVACWRKSWRQLPDKAYVAGKNQPAAEIIPRRTVHHPPPAREHASIAAGSRGVSSSRARHARQTADVKHICAACSRRARHRRYREERPSAKLVVVTHAVRNHSNRK